MMLLEPGEDEGMMKPVLQVFRDPGNSPHFPYLQSIVIFPLSQTSRSGLVFYIFLGLPELIVHTVPCYG